MTKSKNEQELTGEQQAALEVALEGEVQAVIDGGETCVDCIAKEVVHKRIWDGGVAVSEWFQFVAHEAVAAVACRLLHGDEPRHGDRDLPRRLHS